MTCPVTGKLQYPSAQAAHKALQGMESTKERSDKAVRADWHRGKAEAYRCAHCSQWHVGHKARSNARHA